MSKTVNTYLAFFSGIAAGALVGMLYAPDKGANTRDTLTFLLYKYKMKIKELKEALVDGRDMYSSEAKSEGQRVVTDAKTKAERLLQDVDDLIGQIKGKDDTTEN